MAAKGDTNDPLRAYETIIQIWTPMAASESAMMKQQNITNPNIISLLFVMNDNLSVIGNKYGNE